MSNAIEGTSRREADTARIPDDNVVVLASEAHEIVGEVGAVQEARLRFTWSTCDNGVCVPAVPYNENINIWEKLCKTCTLPRCWKRTVDSVQMPMFEVAPLTGGTGADPCVSECLTVPMKLRGGKARRDACDSGFDEVAMDELWHCLGY